MSGMEGLCWCCQAKCGNGDHEASIADTLCRFVAWAIYNCMLCLMVDLDHRAPLFKVVCAVLACMGCWWSKHAF